MELSGFRLAITSDKTDATDDRRVEFVNQIDGPSADHQHITAPNCVSLVSVGHSQCKRPI
jgi:hypothetical protein